MHPVQWILSIKADKTMAYKDIPGKYILNLFHRNQGPDIPGFFAEVAADTSYDPSTKRLFHADKQFGFIMRDYGLSLLDIDENFEKRKEIAALLAVEVKTLFVQGKTHVDIKPDNACYNDAYY